jgi:hypothetical protein
MMFEESGARSDREERASDRRSRDANPMGESYYSSEHDDMLHVDRRSMRRSQTYWVAGEHLESRFADHVQVTQVDEHYHLTFGQSRIPISREATETASVAEVLPIARLILPEDVIKRLAITLSEKMSR